ncbi:conserved hypothetical protein [Theileria orientalis strain Shintoku]|uniref:Uncharacterized protein n=1 Tax=Theileria orientalis strain Shintoku TaxID=869250 RepID=J4DP28_THEOR|nr:conserved hypothetical protein [Theileria orientalis strain Shintoku]BAM39984.1 conserved hypothetical protein [Theileria orientalis strain Shintoku]|eukprot:XP_009690285.1 conserved hypothetical protein [Theileria orientalis strain Shintoku]
MELNDLSESQQELLHPLIRLKTDVSLDSLVVLRDVFSDLAEAYDTFATSIKDAEQKLLTCYNLASSGSLTPQACEALLMVRGNMANVSNVVLSATAEQAGVLSVMQGMVSFLNRVKEESSQLSNRLEKEVVIPFSAFSTEYLKTFGKDEKRAFRQDISGFIPKLKEFKKSPNYSHSQIKKYVDGVLKAHKELQECTATEEELAHHGSHDPKQISKAKSRTARAKLALGNQIRDLFAAAPELNEIGSLKNSDVDTLSQLSKLSKKQAESQNKDQQKGEGANFAGNAAEYQTKFCDLEKKRLDLISSCFQHWMDNHAKYEKGVYSELEKLWKDVAKFYPNGDYQKFEAHLTGKSVQVEAKHSRMFMPREPGPIDDYTTLTLNTFSNPSTPMEVSENEGYDMERYDLYKGNKGGKVDVVSNKQRTSEALNVNSQVGSVPGRNTIDNLTVVQMMKGHATTPPSNKKDANRDHRPGKKHGNQQQSSSTNVKSPTAVNEAPEWALKRRSQQDKEGRVQHEHEKVETVEKSQEQKIEVKLEDKSTKSGRERRSSVGEKVAEVGQSSQENKGAKLVNQDAYSQLVQKTERLSTKLGEVKVAVPGEAMFILESTRRRLDNHMLNLFNRCRTKNTRSRFDWLADEIEDIVKIFEDYDTYPFTIDYENLAHFKRPSDINVPMLRYALFDKYMDEGQWDLLSLEALMLTHRHISSFVNHPELAKDEGDLRDYLLANLGVLDQTLIKFRKTIETYRSRCAVTDFEYAILEIVLKPRDTFTSQSPSTNVHIMDVRYRVLLLIDSFSKGEIAIHSEKLFVIPEFYRWMYRQLHVVQVSLLQKLSRVINLIPTHSEDLQEQWLRCLNSKSPEEELKHGFKFEEDAKASKMCNEVLLELMKALGKVNGLKEFAISKMTKKTYQEPLDRVKAMLLELLKSMVTVEELDENCEGNNNEEEVELKEEDFAIDLDFYNDDDISVLAELRRRRALCFRQCIPREYRTKPGKFISRKAAKSDLSSPTGWNRYFKKRVDPIALSKCWGMEEPVVLMICSSLHKYLSCDNIAYSEFPQYFQAVIYTTSFMQTGVLPNFNVLKRSVKGNENSNFKNQVPIVAHSILAARAYWFSKIVNPEAKGVDESVARESETQKQEEGATEQTDEFYKRLRISLTGIKERLHSMLNSKFKVTEGMAKQLYILLQMPSNVHYLPTGLGDLNSYLLFDMGKYRSGGVYKPEDLLPEYIYHDKSCIELVTLKNLNDVSKSVVTQMKGMHLDKAYNKVHVFMSKLLKEQAPVTLSMEEQDDQWHQGDHWNQRNQRNQLDEWDQWNYSLLTPSRKERTAATALYLRFIAATFKNELFKCLCEYAKFIKEEALFYILAIFVIMFRVLYPRLSENIPYLSLFESDEESDLYNMINVFRFIVNKNAIIFTDECIEGTRETNDVSLDENALFPLVVEEMLQMLRHQCTVSSSIWNGFVQYAEFSSLLANCSILHLKRAYRTVAVNPAVLMFQLRKLMLFQREVDASYIVRAPVSDPGLQEQRLLNCMFFTYKNSNHKLSGHIEFIKMIKESLIRALEHKFVGITELVDSAVKHENWQSIGPENMCTSGAVDLITVLKFSISASFELAPPVEWLILPFTNACESSLRSYYRGISNIYALKLLYNIHFYLVQGEPALPDQEGQSEGRARGSGPGGLCGDNGEVRSDDEIEKKSKRTLWKRLKHTIGGKSPKGSTHANFLANLESYAKHFENKSVMEDLARVSSLDYVANQIIEIPGEIFQFYYNQLRSRDPEYEFLHKAIGTSTVSDAERFFFIEPHQLLQLPHSKSLSSLILASQRILKRDANQCILDVITIVMWKVVFVDFRKQIFYSLYSPDILEGHKIENIVERFPETVHLFVERLPEAYVQFAYNNFFEAFLKSIFYVIRYMRHKDYKFNRTNLKVLYHDVDSLTRLLEKHSQDNLGLLNNVKNYITKLA